MPRVLIPVAGLAVRLGGTVKYLLPLFDEDGKVTTLLREHMRLAQALGWETTVLTRIDARELIYNYLKTHDLANGVKVWSVCAPDTMGAPTETMNQSVVNGIQQDFDWTRRTADTLMLMGDTFFYTAGDRLPTLVNLVKEMQRLLSDDEKTVAVLLLFPIRKEQIGKLGQVDFDGETKEVRNIVDKTPNCTLPYAWGAMMYKHKFMNYVREKEPHLGYAIMPAIRAGWKVKVVVANYCSYYDCGTLHEYASLLKSLEEKINS